MGIEDRTISLQIDFQKSPYIKSWCGLDTIRLLTPKTFIFAIIFISICCTHVVPVPKKEGARY